MSGLCMGEFFTALWLELHFQQAMEGLSALCDKKWLRRNFYNASGVFK